jgi:long-chain fatty acid transport protein
MTRRAIALGALCAAAALAAAPARGAGFGIFEQGSKAMGMAGAFTAQADDPSAMFHNPAGLAFQKNRDFAAGVTWIRGTEADFQGGPTGFPGAGVSAEQETLSEFPPHAYWVEPLGANVTFGLGVNSPFGLVTEWDDDFPGRFISRKAALRALDVNPVIAWQAGNFGLAVGGIARFSDVELVQHLATLNPLTQTTQEVGALTLDTDFEQGYGFNVGLLHRYNNSFSWGVSYRSTVEVDYGGDGDLRQILTGTPFDAAVAAILPFGEAIPAETSIEFPDQASLGLAFALSPHTLLEVDANWTGWSSFDEIVIDFTRDQLPDTVRPQQWDDCYNYRVGVRWDTATGNQWRFGFVFDETPQPEEAVSPLLPDADRNGYTIGYGWQGGGRTSFDFAVMYLDFDERERFRDFPGEEASQFHGTYQNKAVLVGLTLGF